LHFSVQKNGQLYLGLWRHLCPGVCLIREFHYKNMAKP